MWVLKTVVDYGHIYVVFRAIPSRLKLSLKSQNLLSEDMSDWDGYVINKENNASFTK